MYLIIYKKENGKPLLQETISSFYTKETYNTSNNYAHVVKTHGGVNDDYAVLWLEDNETILKTYTHEYTVQKGEIIFGTEKVFEVPPKEPSLDDYLLDLDYRLSTVELGI